MLNAEQVQRFDRDGFVLVENVFSPEEIAILIEEVEQGQRVKSKTSNMPDAAGRSSKLALWMDEGQDVFSAVSFNPRIVNNVRMLLREDVYHWHSKVMLKEPKVGGAWEWHQDYGYWYNDGVLYPRMLSCMVALDPATKANGCLKVIPGSHLLGRFDHGRVGSQAGIDRDRVNAVLERLPVHYCEAPSGSALFFHGNTFHSSEANTSDRPRRAFICCYNALANAPYGGKGHGKPEPMSLAADDAILAFARAAAR
ncbi:MAG: phytanoyl-CoA dioxygenase family protein [Planctomycetota bacterium]|nr:phytanoyl-CoA dioxygenase family protein [Planctomycetota bacterium]